jgi:uncharacterized protein (TIGR02145 family)
MSIFKQLCRTLVLSAVVVALSVGLMGCPETPDPPDPSGVGNRCGVDGTAGSCMTVRIGNQTWMAENMNKETAESWCYNDSAENCKKYGRLYSWYAAAGVCPIGWHLPDRDEWRALAIAEGGTGDYGDGGAAGTKLKSISGWIDDGNGTNSSGFSGLPGGYRDTRGSFINGGKFGSWWMAAEQDSGNAYHRHLSYRDENLYEGIWGKGDALSVRCIKN